MKLTIGNEAYLINASDLDTESEPEGDDPGDLSASSSDNNGAAGDGPAPRHVVARARGPRGRPRARGPRVPDRDWSPHGQARARFPFTSNPGLKVNIDDPEDPLEFFELFFNDELIDLIVTQTNLFAQQFMNDKGLGLKRRSRAKQWEDTTGDEMRVYLGLYTTPWRRRRAEYQQYFSKRASLDTPFFRDVMDYDRFVLLNKFLHFADNTKAGDDDTIPCKLYKLWPILQHLKRRFSEVYQPERDVAIDESLMLWKGRLGWEQYIPSKRARFGIKSFEICKSSSAYILDFFVYTGEGTVYDPGLDEDLPMRSKVILTLGRQFFNKGYCINMDNFFSSPGLYDELCARSTDAVGTIRPNHKKVYPKTF
ncbi:piggyBac transposable element-derived protein 4-like [Lineus longissimus]|uniref:piggyBac transposable element-derived protein 4-like n=1 Tax=Lineus longissimus TaxID=88925 RepID=UPI00315DD6D8